MERRGCPGSGLLAAPRKKRETCNTAPGDPDSAGGDPTPQEGPQDYSKTEYKNLSPLSPHSAACRGNPEASPDRDSLNPKSRHLGETLHPQPPGPEGPDFHWRSDPQESLSLDQVEVSPRNPPLACSAEEIPRSPIDFHFKPDACFYTAPGRPRAAEGEISVWACVPPGALQNPPGLPSEDAGTYLQADRNRGTPFSPF
ncbi:hypothetical protein NDU88_005885 [Pleurodeles waltl]|uniref:Uncharacterized protein n=1 Tax=Pleurodeles waltl TaxID=8319 RepID=A0AAV7WCP9_PLEWA|nr:hypothetical protein NDU88_005885 [Pleurodeles waltl]